MKKLSVILLAVVMSVTMVVPAFAFDYGVIDVPEVETINFSSIADYPYWFIVASSNGTYNLYFLDVPAFLDQDGFMSTETGYTYRNYYVQVNGDVWKSRGGTYVTDTIVATTPALVSNYDIYDSNGNLYLKKWIPPKPLAETILDLTGDTIKNDTVPSVTSAMTILCVTGVGLLAMLVLLKLFGKRSLIHR